MTFKPQFTITAAERFTASQIVKTMQETLRIPDIAKHFDIPYSYVCFAAGLNMRDSRYTPSYLCPTWVIDRILRKHAEVAA